MTPDLLLRSGFRRYPSDGRTLYQKRVERDGVTLYFVDIFHHPRLLQIRPEYDWSVSARFYLPSGAFLDITYAWDLDLERIESFFARAYEVLGCVPDPHN